MTDLDAIEKRAREARELAAYSPDTMRALADDVIALVAEARLAREWLRDEEASVESCLTSYRDEIAIASRKAYRAFLAKREAP